jgi:aminomethyltransferase
MDFMTSKELKYKGEVIRVSRCGYTGEDGFEISVPEKLAIPFSSALEAGKGADGNPLAKWIGLGARDTLRLEAGLCLYGHELNENISPIDAVLGWTISKRRKEQGGFIGYERVKRDLELGVKSKRSGIIVDGPPARDGVEITTKDGKVVGKITSGSPSPSLKKNICQAYIDVPHNKLETELQVTLRGKQYPVFVKKMPFVPNRYYKKL